MGGGGPPPGSGEPDADDNPLKTLQDVIHAIVGLLHQPMDPEDKTVVSKVLTMLMPLQAKLMSGASGGPSAQGR